MRFTDAMDAMDAMDAIVGTCVTDEGHSLSRPTQLGKRTVLSPSPRPIDD